MTSKTIKILTSRIQQRKHFLYIELTSKQLLLALCKTTRKHIVPEKIEHIALSGFEYSNKNIFNPTALQNHISAFTKKHNLYNPKTLLSVPEHIASSPLKQKLEILQISLCMAKAPIILQAMSTHTLFSGEPTLTKTIKKDTYNKMLQTDLLKTFKHYNENSPYIWLAQTALIVIGLTIILGNIYMKEKEEIKTNDIKKQKLLKKTQALKAQLKKLHTLKEEAEEYRRKTNIIKKLASDSNNPKDLLLLLSKTMPENTWLTELTIKNIKLKKENSEINKTLQPVTNQQKKPKNTPRVKNYTKKKAINLEGKTHDIQEITLLMKRLTESPLIKSMNLAEIKEVKKEPNSNQPCHSFKFEGIRV